MLFRALWGVNSVVGFPGSRGQPLVGVVVPEARKKGQRQIAPNLRKANKALLSAKWTNPLFNRLDPVRIDLYEPILFAQLTNIAPNAPKKGMQFGDPHVANSDMNDLWAVGAQHHPRREV